MKKTLLILSACLCFFTSCHKKQELKPVNIKPITIEQDGAILTSDPRFELLLIASNLAELYPFGNYTSEYTNKIQTFFKNHKEHALIKQIKKMSKKQLFYIDYFMAFNCISEDFTSFSDENIHNSGKEFWKKHKDTFIQNFNSFAHDTNFEKFYLAFEHDLKHQLFHAQEYCKINNSIIPTTNSILYRNNNQKYTVFCSNLFFTNRGTTIPNTSIIRINPDKTNPYTKIEIQLYLLYPTIFNLCDQNWEQIKEPVSALIKTLFEQNQITQKNTDTNILLMLSGLLTDYLTYHFTINEYSEEIQTEIYESYKKYYLYDFYPILQPMFQEYEQNPEKYANFEEFFNNYLVNEIINISLN